MATPNTRPRRSAAQHAEQTRASPRRKRFLARDRVDVARSRYSSPPPLSVRPRKTLFLARHQPTTSIDLVLERDGDREPHRVCVYVCVCRASCTWLLAPRTCTRTTCVRMCARSRVPTFRVCVVIARSIASERVSPFFHRGAREGVSKRETRDPGNNYRLSREPSRTGSIRALLAYTDSLSLSLFLSLFGGNSRRPASSEAAITLWIPMFVCKQTLLDRDRFEARAHVTRISRDRERERDRFRETGPDQVSRLDLSRRYRDELSDLGYRRP